jgi:hypothetical protein
MQEVTMRQTSEFQGHRQASLKLSNGTNGQVITARVPLECSEADFVQVSRAAYGLINKLTGCHCASGRISVVVEDVFADVIQVDLEQTVR